MGGPGCHSGHGRAAGQRRRLEVATAAAAEGVPCAQRAGGQAVDGRRARGSPAAAAHTGRYGARLIGDGSTLLVEADVPSGSSPNPGVQGHPDPRQSVVVAVAHFPQPTAFLLRPPPHSSLRCCAAAPAPGKPPVSLRRIYAHGLTLTRNAQLATAIRWHKASAAATRGLSVKGSCSRGSRQDDIRPVLHRRPQCDIASVFFPRKKATAPQMARARVS